MKAIPRRIENIGLGLLVGVAVWLLWRGYNEVPRYHITCRIGVYTVADFWTTNRLAVEEWKRFKPGLDSPWLLDANRVQSLLDASPRKPLTPDDLTLGVYTNVPVLRFR